MHTPFVKLTPIGVAFPVDASELKEIIDVKNCETCDKKNDCALYTAIKESDKKDCGKCKECDNPAPAQTVEDIIRQVAGDHVEFAPVQLPYFTLGNMLDRLADEMDDEYSQVNAGTRIRVKTPDGKVYLVKTTASYSGSSDTLTFDLLEVAKVK